MNMRALVRSMGAAAVIAVLVLGAGYFSLVEPAVDRLHKLERKEYELKDEVEKNRSRYVNLPGLTAQQSTMRSTIDELKTYMPETLDVEKERRWIRSVAANHGLERISIAFHDRIEHEFSSERPFVLTLCGAFPDVYGFIHEVFYASGRAVAAGGYVLVDAEATAAFGSSSAAECAGDDNVLLLDLEGGLFAMRHA